MKKRSFSKSFIYITQTEQCLPSNLASPSAIGNPRTCNCDVIVLSFQTKCQDQNSSHITYLFDPNTGWRSGRNVLYFTAIKRQPGYHYYIFLDEDAVFGFNEFIPPEMKKLQPFRAVEQWNHGASWTFGRRHKICKITERSLVIPTLWFSVHTIIKLYNTFFPTTRK